MSRVERSGARDFSAAKGDGAVLVFEGVTKRFDRRIAVDDVDLRLLTGRTLGLVGESGSGKTTCIRLALGLEWPTSGAIWFRGRPLRHSRRAMRPVRRQLGFVFQDPYDSLDPRMPLEKIVGEPLRIHNVARQERTERVRAVLADVGLPDAPLDSYPARYSGGGRQRIAIARALVMEPAVLLCDEPTASLDVSVQAQIVNLLLTLQQSRGLSMIFVSHDLGLVRRIADDVVVMYGGQVVESGPAATIYEQARHPYTVALLAAVPGEHPTRRRSVGLSIPEVDQPVTESPGCVFVARCPRAAAVCRSTRPPLSDGPGGTKVACFFPVGAGPESRDPAPTEAPAAVSGET